MRVVGERAGQGLDPEVAACLANAAEEIMALGARTSVWDEVLEREPRPRLYHKIRATLPEDG